MDFSDDEAWQTTVSQENFLTNYFGKPEVLGKRKRRKLKLKEKKLFASLKQCSESNIKQKDGTHTFHNADNINCVNKTIKTDSAKILTKTKKRNEKIFNEEIKSDTKRPKESNIKQKEETHTFHNADNINCVNKTIKTDSKQIFTKKKKKNEKNFNEKIKNCTKRPKVILKTGDNSLESNLLDANVNSQIADCQSEPLTNEVKKTKKREVKKKERMPSKFTADEEENSQIAGCQSEPLTNKVKTKKLEVKKKKNMPSKFTAEEESEECDNEEELRCLIKNSKTFNKIQKLMLEAPFLNPNYGYNEKDNLSDSSFHVSNTIDGDLSSNDFNNSSCIQNETPNKKRKLHKQEDSIQEYPDLDQSIRKKKQKKDKISSDFASPAGSDLKLPCLINKESSADFQRSHSQGFTSAKENSSNVLRNKAVQKLKAAKFRYLNEQLYTISGKDSFTYFQQNKKDFNDYHEGYNLQVSKWPMNPVDKIISDLSLIQKTLVIADMGCGDAKIAQTLTQHKVHSFDLVSLNRFVTACDVSKVPLSKETVDVVVFSLSLMGTNFKDYLNEAYRILKLGGHLKIAEVESRIEDLDEFIKYINKLGFSLENKNVEHKLFVFVNFTKTKKSKKSKKTKKINSDLSLKPCLYKKR